MSKKLLPFSSSIEPKERKFIVRWFLFGLVLHLIAAWFSQGFYHYDEHYQLLEFAGLKEGYTTVEDLPWEYEAQIRPTLQPVVAWGFIKAAQWLDMENPFGIARALRFLSALMGWYGTLLLTMAVLPWFRNKWQRKALVVLSSVLWLLIFMHVRFSSESWANTFAFAGLALIIHQYNGYKEHGKEYKLWPLLWAGFLFGLSFVVRFQSGLLFPGLFLWMLVIARIPFKILFATGLALVAAIGVGFVTDQFFYGNWVNTAYRYYEVNLVQGKAAEFGVEPWWWYIWASLQNGLFPFKLVILASVIVACIRFPRNPLVWMCLPFMLAHFTIGHKALRFIFPLMNALPVLVILAFRDISYQKLSKSFRHYAGWAARFVAVVFLVVNFAEVWTYCFHSIKPFLKPLEYVYNRYPDRKTTVVMTDRYAYLSLTGLKMNYYLQDHLVPVYARTADSIAYEVNRSPYPVMIIDNTKGYTVPDELRKVAHICEAEYAGLPFWVRNFNINNWTDRTSFWKVYGCARKAGEGQ